MQIAVLQTAMAGIGLGLAMAAIVGCYRLRRWQKIGQSK